MTEERKHTEISPSKLERILLCPGSLQLCRQIEQKSANSAAERGTRLHDLMEKLINAEITIAEVSKEDRAAIEFAYDAYTDFVSTIETPDEDGFIEIDTEQWVSIQTDPEIGGTADVVIHNKNFLAILDFKFGHTEVMANDNSQLMAYALGFAKKYNLGSGAKVVMGIIQPALGKVEYFELNAGALYLWAQDVSIRTFEAMYSKNPRIEPGEKQCKWCPAIGICPESYKHIMDNAQKVFTAYRTIGELAPEKLTEIMQIIPELKSAIKAIENQALVFAGSNKLPGYKLVRTRGNRKWANDDKVFELLESIEVEQKLKKKGLVIDDLWDISLKSPSKIETLVGKAFFKTLELDAYIDRLEGACTVVTEDDPRPNVAENPFADYASAGNGEN